MCIVMENIRVKLHCKTTSMKKVLVFVICNTCEDLIVLEKVL